MGCIYRITNIVTNKVYIGSAVNFSKRKCSHLWYLRRNRHHNTHLQRSFVKYGEAAFVFAVEENVVDDTYLLQREQACMDRYRANGVTLYNVCPVAGSTLGSKRSRQHSTLMSKLKTKAVAPRVFLSPGGKYYAVRNMAAFGRKFRLCPIALRRVSAGLFLHHRGWLAADRLFPTFKCTSKAGVVCEHVVSLPHFFRQLGFKVVGGVYSKSKNHFVHGWRIQETMSEPKFVAGTLPRSICARGAAGRGRLTMRRTVKFNNEVTDERPSPYCHATG